MMDFKGIASKAIKLCEACFEGAKKWMLDFPAAQITNKKCYEKAGYIDTGNRDIKNEKFTLAVLLSHMLTAMMNIKMNI
jgi:hypothetical protein